MPSFAAWQLGDVSFSGTPFNSNATADSSDVGTTFVINPGARPKLLTMGDNDSNFEDGDSSQQLSGGHSFNGRSFASGTDIETEYSYVVRPAGGDPGGADDIRIYAVELAGDVEGFVADAHMSPGITYTIVAIDQNDPVVGYSSLYVCFRAGTPVATSRGAVPVERVRPGMLVQTADNGMQPVLWAGASRVPGQGAQAPVVFASGVLGNAGPLWLSPQHRVPVEGGRALVAAKAMEGRPGVARRPVPLVTYVHLMLERHELIRTGGAFTESFNPGPEALGALGARRAAEVTGLCGRSCDDGPILPPAREILRPGAWRRGRV